MRRTLRYRQTGDFSLRDAPHAEALGTQSRPVSIEHYENFPVASALCPPRLRPAVLAIYAFARTADDLADEGDAPAAERLAWLRQYRADLLATFEGRPAGSRWPGVFERLGRARQAHDLPLSPFLRLLDAFERDTQAVVYRTRAELLGYCALSANPVGHLLLHLYGQHGAAQRERSDAICSALQLVNFWQDLGADLSRQRIYLPLEDAARHGVDLHDPAALRDAPATRALVAELCGWARTLMLQGAPLACELPGRVGWELRLVVQGGLRILDKIAQVRHATIAHRPVVGAADLPAMLWSALRMRPPSPTPTR
jgi:squalene synthase HpnC